MHQNLGNSIISQSFFRRSMQKLYYLLFTLLTKSAHYLEIRLRYMFGILASFDNISYLIVFRSLPEYGLFPTIN